MRLRLDGDRLVMSDKRGVKLYDISGAQPALLAQVEVAVLADPFAEHSDGEQISQVVSGVFARMFTVEQGKKHWTELSPHITLYDMALTPLVTYEAALRLDAASLSLSPDGAQLASVDHGGGVVVFDARTGSILRSADGCIASGTSWSPDGRMIAAGDTDQDDGELYVLELTGEDELTRHELPAPSSDAPLNDSPYASTWSPDGALVAISCAAWGERGVTVYDVAARDERWSALYDLDGDEDAESWQALEVAFVAGGAVVIAGVEGGVRAWRAADGAKLKKLTCKGASSTGFAADEARRCIWYDRKGEPARADYPEDWR